MFNCKTFTEYEISNFHGKHVTLNTKNTTNLKKNFNKSIEFDDRRKPSCLFLSDLIVK